MIRPATIGCYALLGAAFTALGIVRFVDWVNYWMQKPTDRAKGGGLRG
jgi:hypothetical protein